MCELSGRTIRSETWTATSLWVHCSDGAAVLDEHFSCILSPTNTNCSPDGVIDKSGGVTMVDPNAAATKQQHNQRNLHET